jgi:6-pyruvoyl-tetrahydropterin synthase
MAYSVSVRQPLHAKHVLPIESGPESTVHTHPFIIDVDVTGPTLDSNGFLLDIIHLNRTLHTLLSRFNGTVLNDQHEFQETVPTLEEIARILWIGLLPALKNTTVNELRVRVWESTQASAAYEGAIPP